MADSEDKAVMFDAEANIRILDPDKYEASTKMVNSTKEYMAKMESFKNVVGQTMAMVQQLGAAIEREKLRAIGARNACESEAEARRRAVHESALRVKEKQSELDRYIAEYNSLLKVETEQRHVIERLSCNE
jgi:intraflagellar transport protein 20